MAWQGILAVLVLLSQGLPSTQEDTCTVGEDERVRNLLLQMLAYSNFTDTPSPGFLLVFSLRRDYNVELAGIMVQKLKEDAVHRVENNLDFPSGTVALYVMALQASCANPRAVSAFDSTIDLVQLLEDKYEQELDSNELKMQENRDKDHDDGSDDGREEGRDEDHIEGHDEGHDNGSDEGHDEGHDEDHNEQRDKDHNNGSDEGHDEGHDEGRDEDHDEVPDKDRDEDNDKGTEKWGNRLVAFLRHPPRGRQPVKERERQSQTGQGRRRQKRMEMTTPGDVEVVAPSPPETMAEGESTTQRGPETIEDEDRDKHHDEDHDKEKPNQPLTNYYQTGWNIMALCLQDVPIHLNNVLDATCIEHPDGFDEKFTMDEASVMILALTCVSKRFDMPEDYRTAVHNTLSCLAHKIIRNIQADGLIGDIHSTGLAMQALSVIQEYSGSLSWNCSQTQSAMLDAVANGQFSNPLDASHIIPSFNGRTYLDVGDLDCTADQDNLPNISFPPNPSDSNRGEITVTYRVVDSVHLSFNNSIALAMPEGSSFLAVLETAQSLNPQQFSFTTEDTSGGPSVVSINGLAADSTTRTYWQLQSGGKPLDQGVADYRPREGEELAAVYTTWE